MHVSRLGSQSRQRPTASVTVAAGESVLITANTAFGTTTGAGGLDIYPCYRASGTTGTPLTVGLGMFDIAMPANTRLSMGVTGIASGIAAGDYDVGMCGDDDGDGNWNNNEWGYVSALVFN